MSGDWELSGSYLESCNCDAICPCRRIDDVAGGRSTHGLCTGVLSWVIERGHRNGLDLAGCRVVIVSRYHDDEPGSPWTFALYLDRSASDEQREALTDIYTGAAGGTPLRQFPWAWKPSSFRGTRPADIEIDHAPGAGRVHVRDAVDLEIRGPVPNDASVSCVIPGHHRRGRELYAERLAADAGEALRFEVTGTCAYEADFAYSSQQ